MINRLEIPDVGTPVTWYGRFAPVPHFSGLTQGDDVLLRARLLPPGQAREGDPAAAEADETLRQRNPLRVKRERIRTSELQKASQSKGELATRADFSIERAIARHWNAHRRPGSRVPLRRQY